MLTECNLPCARMSIGGTASSEDMEDAGLSGVVGGAASVAGTDELDADLP
eukprot:COSAG02_NODE_2741_length_8123_cov_5.360793_4_plen_50_part_00